MMRNMIDLNKLKKENSLNAIYTINPLKSMTVFHEVFKLSNLNSLIVDVNRKWSSIMLPEKSHIILPEDKNDLLNVLVELPDFMEPRLDLIWIEELPNYFREFYNNGESTSKNMAAFGFCLSLLKNLSEKIPLFFTTYASTMNKNETIYPQHTNYYADRIIKCEFVKSIIEVKEVSRK